MKLNRLLIVLCITLFVFSCKDEIELQGELIEVKLSPSYVSINPDTDVPMGVKGNSMKMSVDANQVIYAIQVYENDSAYYYGLFDEVDSMKITLTTTKNYRFKIAAYQVGTGSGLKQNIRTDGKYFYLPDEIKLDNKFIKGNALKDINLISSIKLNTPEVKDYPEIDVFYCEKTVKAEKTSSDIGFNLLRMGFGVKYKLNGLVNEDINIIMGNDTTILNSSTGSKTQIRLFNVASGSMSTIFAKANSYADSILIKFQWVATNGTVYEKQEKLEFTRNYQKTINIQLNTSGLYLNFEEWVNNSVTDIDGNVYSTVTIGTQTWMAENLKTTHYRNGDPIPNVTGDSQWGNLYSGAYCWYDNNIANKDIYGALYNGYAVKDSRNIAPQGWHVPTKEEWITLINYLGGDSVAGGKLKQKGTAYWDSPNTGASNSSEFNALPGGYRQRGTGIFLYKGTNAYFRSSTEEFASGYDSAWLMMLWSQASKSSVTYAEKTTGFSVRCIKD
ncbi:MAG: fibrobacter succinogenes major paralogous domain-containing protein [Paludibacter sp.]|nr:fibrobacter succinogenes major paralogous domain-containing protein [Paludibacter sp.]